MEARELVEWLSFLGLKVVTLVAGFFGATVALTVAPKLGPWQLVTSVFGGLAIAVFIEPLVSYYLKVPAGVQGGIAFILGLAGVVIAAGIIEVAKALPAIAIKRIRRIFGDAE
ncbi:MAG: hypothetical protein BGO72_21385 [Burkholderiales bacterium 70-64]|nr:MAG: hypothetical protein BGO72_21385 [Burkholderiales bacterium 70-64]